MENLTSSQKGEIARLKVVQRAIEKGCIPSRTIESARYDLILDDGTIRYRAQVKYADGKMGHSTGAVVANLRRQKGDDRNLKYCRSSSRTYTTEEIDAVLIYVPKVDSVCWFGPEHFLNKPSIAVRYEFPKNGYKKNVKMVKDFIW